MAQQPEPQIDYSAIYRTTITTNRGTIVMDLDPQLAGPAKLHLALGVAARLGDVDESDRALAEDGLDRRGHQCGSPA